MKTDIWMPLYINDYLGDTMELDAEGHGAYMLLLMAFWKKGPLPSDKRKLMRIARTQDGELLDEVLEDFFYLTEDGYSQRRAEEEKGKAQKNKETARENGKKGGRPKTQKKPKENPEVNPEETHGLTQEEPSGEAKPNPEKSSSPSPSPSPITSKSNTPLTPRRGTGVIGSDFVDDGIKHWNSLQNLPRCRYLSTNLPEVRDVAIRIAAVGPEAADKAMDNLAKFWEYIEPRYRPSSFHRFITRSLDNWLDDAQPWERYEGPEKKETVSACAPASDHRRELSEEEYQEAEEGLADLKGAVKRGA